MFRKLLRVGAVALAAAAYVAPAAADWVRIDNPTADGVPIDWCARWGQGCGWQGAHAFCRDRGYERALAYEVFQPGRTYLAGADQFCTGATCTAFQSVTCKTPAAMSSPPPAPPVTQPLPARPARVRFDHPRNDGLPADWCSLRELDCGWGGAHKFCEFRGFDRAVEWSVYRPGATRVAGDSARCDGPRCVGLRHVVCDRQDTVEPPPGDQRPSAQAAPSPAPESAPDDHGEE